MKIVIDARLYGLEHAGLGRYLINLIEQINEIDKKNDYFILLRKKYFGRRGPQNKNTIQVLADYPHYSLKEQVLLPLQLNKLKPDLVHFPHFNVPICWFGRSVVTIHDLIKHQSRGIKTTTRSPIVYWIKFLFYQLTVRLAMKKAKRIIVPSKFWQKELVNKYKIEKGKIKVIYEGVDPKVAQGKADKKEKNQFLVKHQVKKPYLLYTGSLYPHKNVLRLVKAVKSLADLKLTLIVVCARNVFHQRFMKQVRKIKAEDQVRLVGFVPDQTLAFLYQNAAAFVTPTLVEGFGLPGLEAMALGCPVLCSDIPVLREVYDQAALFFDPFNERDIARKIKTIIGNKKLKAKLIRDGFTQVEKYSWRDTAQKTITIYNNVLNPHV